MGRRKKTIAEKCESLAYRSLDGAKGLDQLGALSNKLGALIGEALDDENQFHRFIVSEKGKNEEGEAVTESVEKIFEKVDFKSVKEAASAIKAVAESVRSVWAVPDFQDAMAISSGKGSEPLTGEMRVTFDGGEDYSL